LNATDEEVYEACKAASIHEKIITFPDGYKTKVGERGVKLSGGELQRVSIARVFLKNPQIVLLDEATSAVDSSTEAQIQESFKKLSAGRTTFIIAHRLSTIMDADRILVVDNGEIVERGTHQELLERGGRYVDLWTKQSSKKTSSENSSVTAEGDVQDLLIPGLPPSSPSVSEAKASGFANETSLLDQVDGQSESKQLEGSDPKRSRSVRKRFHNLQARLRNGHADDSDEAGDDTADEAPLTVISPRPTVDINAARVSSKPGNLTSRRRSSVSSKVTLNSTGTQVKHVGSIHASSSNNTTTTDQPSICHTFHTSNDYSKQTSDEVSHETSGGLGPHNDTA